MISKSLNQITKEDLQLLIQNSVSEGKTIDYKIQFPDNSDAARKEFLADISSFANASGGDLIFGIKENNGIPTEIVGITVDNQDLEIRRFEDIIRSGIDPRVSVAVHTVNLPNNKIIFIFRISKSWLSPHRVIYKSHDKFYSRNSAGKYPLDTIELRTAFNLSQTLIDKIQGFKIDRISQLHGNITPISSFPDGAKVILHLLPFEAFNPEQSLDLSPILQDSSKLPPIFNSGWNREINFEGVMTYSSSKKSYVQMYRSGIIEAVDSEMLSTDTKVGRLAIAGYGYEYRLLRSLYSYLKILKELNVNPPIVCFLTLTRIKGYAMEYQDSFGDEGHKIDRDILQLPERIIESFDVKPEEILRPTFDLIWNACGLERSPNFDVKGKFIRQ